MAKLTGFPSVLRALWIAFALALLYTGASAEWELAPPAGHPAETRMLSELGMLALGGPANWIVIDFEQSLQASGWITSKFSILLEWLLLWPALAALGYVQWFVAIPRIVAVVRRAFGR